HVAGPDAAGRCVDQEQRPRWPQTGRHRRPSAAQPGAEFLHSWRQKFRQRFQLLAALRFRPSPRRFYPFDSGRKARFVQITGEETFPRSMVMQRFACLAVLASWLWSVGGAAAQNPIIVIDTSKGKIECELFADKAPATVKNILQYVEDKHYDGVI